MTWSIHPRLNKYGNIQKKHGGRTYHSTLEADYAAHLDLLIKAGEVQSWQPQPRFPLKVEGKLICSIIPDFLVVGKHGREEIHETKSWATQTPEWRIKWRLMQVLYPEYRYIVMTRKDF